MKRATKKTILACDPSFTAWGWAVLDTDSNVLDCGCIKTEKESKKRNLREPDDRVRRIQSIVHRLRMIINNYNVGVIVYELPHGSQNANAAYMMGAVPGIIETLANLWVMPVEQYSEKDAKIEVFGRISATKKEMIEAMSLEYYLKWTGVKYMDEAIADALAIHYTAKRNSNLLKML